MSKVKKSSAYDFEKYLKAKSDKELVCIVAEEYADSGLSKEELLEAGIDGIAKARENDYPFAT